MIKNTKETPLGWGGLGVMGRAMCEHLIKAGYPMTVYTRTKSKAEALIELGAQWADSPKAVAAKCEVTFSIVGFPDDVREVYLGPDGILAGAKASSIAVDMTTTEPSLAREIHASASENAVRSIDAPVSGGDVGAKNGALSIMVGGDKQVVDAIMPLLNVLGKNIVY